MTTDERIEELERGLASARRFNRWLLAAVGVALGLSVLAGALGPTTAGAQAGGVGAPADVAADAARERAGMDTGTVTPEGKYIGPRVRTPEERAAAGEYVHPEVLHRYRLEQAKKQAELATVNEVRARRFVLVDEAGKTRAALQMVPTGAGLDLYDAAGKRRAALSADKLGARLALLDENGRCRVMLTLLGTKAWNEGTNTLELPHSSLDLYDENGKVIWTAGGAVGGAASPGQAAPPAPQWRSCPECGGSGNNGFVCPSCNGRGNDGHFVCSACNGKGVSNCWLCGGKGVVNHDWHR